MKMNINDMIMTVRSVKVRYRIMPGSDDDPITFFMVHDLLRSMPVSRNTSNCCMHVFNCS